MFPNLYYFFREVFGWELPALQIFNTFGFFVALSFGVCSWLLKKELKRKEKEGKIPYQIKEITVGEKPDAREILTQGILGFIFAWKIIGAMMDPVAFQADIGGYIFSTEGSLIAGFIGGILVAYDKYRSMKKNELPSPQVQKVKVFPSDRIGEIVLTLGISGFVGAKIFNALETWDDFIRDPIANLISGSGLTFLGGLILAGIASYYLMRKMKVNFLVFADTIAPIMLLAYAIGRMGCLFAGDGDWGVYNSAYFFDESRQETRAVERGEFRKYVDSNDAYFYSMEIPQSRYVEWPSGLSFMPKGLLAYTFPHNVNNAGYKMPGCEGKYCSRLPWPVFPTPFYEIIMSFMAFYFLWNRRRKYFIPGMMLAAYLVLAGLERFLIEPLRVNYRYDWGWLHPSQAQIISAIMILAGIWFYYNRKNTQKNEGVVE